METMQQPIHSPFNAESTAAAVTAGHDLNGKTAIVTGGNSGIGLEIVKVLANAGAQVIIGARDAGKATDALQQLHNVSFIPLDLSDPVSVNRFAEQFLAEHHNLDYLFNNAGLFNVPSLQLDKRGYELQFGVNHLGHFQLTGRLWPALKRSGAARVINTSSIGHRHMALQPEDINFEQHSYDTRKAYGQSKTANVLFTIALDHIGQQHGIRAYAVHPGAVDTAIFRYMSPEEYRTWSQAIKTFKTPEQGAATLAWCALSPQLAGIGGVYCENCNIAERVPADVTVPYGVRPHALDPVQAATLWQLSERITGVRFS
ncbi:SDR family NAD(P)-dependent oxidoreductase [Chitinophaga sp. G-6-1-13]|uniref:SDR family NAD(P)-dependent oxidoreductase n=1 Tax=Chitinophaga fulva TaxID=2728842 RepID=A0A848GUN3_9BACT|nr:SDR family NAD(P)-dependent oxidoreductase [Chitinophaga fulva]NML41049.1 SDR family NAD(P)-dependent oxidoreductase [Chitinophaga fulva]